MTKYEVELICSWKTRSNLMASVVMLPGQYSEQILSFVENMSCSNENCKMKGVHRIPHGHGGELGIGGRRMGMWGDTVRLAGDSCCFGLWV